MAPCPQCRVQPTTPYSCCTMLSLTGTHKLFLLMTHRKGVLWLQTGDNHLFTFSIISLPFISLFLLFSSIYERWLRTHQPLRSSYPRANAPIGHNDGYYMVPFLPLHRNGDYFLSNKALGFEYAYLLDPGEYRTTNSSSKQMLLQLFFYIKLSVLCISTTGQRFVQEFLTPYLQQAEEIWQWLLGAGILGALIATIIAALVVTARRKWKRNQRRKRVSSYGERQPLLQSSSEEGSSYQTTL